MKGHRLQDLMDAEGSATTYYQPEPGAPWHRMDPKYGAMALCGRWFPVVREGGLRSDVLPPRATRCTACAGKT
jgi:hypothetical protein